MDLFDIYVDYRSGNKSAFDRIFTDKVTYDEYDSGLESNIQELNSLVKKLYKKYTVNELRPKSDKYPKYNEAPYFESLYELQENVAIILLKIFDDESFSAKSPKELYGKIKYLTTKYINQSIDSTSQMCFNDNGDEFLLKIKSRNNSDNSSRKSISFSGGIKELYQILTEFDVCELFSTDAKVQKNIIKLIRKCYVPEYNVLSDEVCFPKDKQMVGIYETEYGETIDEAQYSRAIKQIKKQLLSYTTSFKGADISEDTINKFSAGDGGRYIMLSSDDTIRALEIALELKEYTPTEIQNDRYYNLISSDFIKEICWSNKAVIHDIQRKSELSLDDYEELLCAVGFILYDYSNKKISEQLEKFISEYSSRGYKINVSIDELSNLAMGNNQKKIWWNLYQSKDKKSSDKDGFSILRLKQSNDGTNTFKSYGKLSDNIRLSEDVLCYQIGKCKCFIDGKSIYCYPADMELFFVKRKDNKYVGYRSRKNFSDSV